MICGITGHQRIEPPESVDWVAHMIEEFVSSHSVHQGLTCLADGADQLFANKLIQVQIPFTAVIPCSNYEDAFSSRAAAEHYRKLLARAAAIDQLQYDAPSSEAFMEAGKRVVDRCDVLLAVWDGEDSAGYGGTADVVSYAKRRKTPVYQLEPGRKRAGFI